MANPAVSQPDDDPDDAISGARLFMAIRPSMLADIEDFRFANRYKSQSAAVRKLLELGLRTAAWEAQKKPKA